MSTSRVLRSRQVVLAEGVAPASIHLGEDGLIAHVGSWDETLGLPVEDFGELAILPGLVDTHVHINDPGRDTWEGFETATKAAAAGGITTLVDMPLNSVPATTSMAGLAAKRAAAEGRCWVDVGVWGGVVPGNACELGPLIEAGVLGFKAFMVPSGVAEFEHVGEAELRAVAPILAELGVPLLIHAESPEAIDAAASRAEGLSAEERRLYRSYMQTRPDEAEVDAIAFLLELAEVHRVRIHIVHLATQRAIFRLDEARQDGLPVTVETCPHYLYFSDRQIPDGATEFKCAPPIRDESNRLGLWEGLRSGVIDLVASDHSPSPPALKCQETGDFMAAWGGIASLQVGLSVMWTEGRRRGFGLADVARWMAQRPAELAGLGDRGVIAAGRRADLCVFDPEAEWVVDGAQLHHRHKLTPYHGQAVRGRVMATLLGGETVYANGALTALPRGRMLRRQA